MAPLENKLIIQINFKLTVDTHENDGNLFEGQTHTPDKHMKTKHDES